MSDDHDEASFAIAPPAQGIVLPLSTVSARKLAATLYNSSPRSHIRSRPASVSNSDSPPSSVSGKQPSKQNRNELRTWSSRMQRALEEKPLERSTQSDSGTPSLPAELKQQKMAMLQQAHHGRGRNNEAEEEEEEEEEEDVRICFMSEKLKREQSSRRKLEMENSKLSRCLLEAESAVARIEKELDKERKARKLMEDVCNELAREIGEDRVEVEKLRREQLRSRQRQQHLQQKAFDWHEEGAQMKLSEATRISFDKMDRELSILLESMRARGVDASLELQGESVRASMEELRSYGGFGGSRSYPRDHHHHHHAIVSSDSMNSSRQDEKKDRFCTAALGPAKWSLQPLQRRERSFRHGSSSELLAEQPVWYQSSISELPSPKWECRGMESRRSSVDWSNRPIKNNSLQAKLMLEDQINGLDSQLKQSRRSTR